MVIKQTKTELPHPHEGKKSNGKHHANLAFATVSVVHDDHALKEGIAKTLSNLTTIEADIAFLARKAVSDTLRTGGMAGGELVNVVHLVVISAIGAAEQVGTGLTLSIKGVAKGIVIGVHDVGGDVVTASSETVRSIIKHAATIGADIGVVARRAVDGVIEAAVETGGNVAQIGKHAVEGAIEEAGKVSNMTVKTVKEVLIGIVGSLDETIGALPRTKAHPHEAGKKPVHHS